MRYKYKITEVNKEPEEVQAMSYKKMLKSLLLKTPKFTGVMVYINKKGRKITRSFLNGRENTYGDNQYNYEGTGNNSPLEYEWNRGSEIKTS